jgi:hypothetical protein
MNDVVQLDFYTTIPEKDAIVLRESEGKIIAIARNAIVDIGLELIMAKKLVGHGSFMRWRQERLSFSDDTAERYMNVAQSFDTNSALVRNLGPKILYELAAPKNESIRDNVLEQIQTGEIEPSVKSVKQEIQVKKALTDSEIANLPQVKALEQSRQVMTQELMYAKNTRSRLEQEIQDLQGKLSSDETRKELTEKKAELTEAKTRITELQLRWNEESRKILEERDKYKADIDKFKAERDKSREDARLAISEKLRIEGQLQLVLKEHETSVQQVHARANIKSSLKQIRADVDRYMAMPIDPLEFTFADDITFQMYLDTVNKVQALYKALQSLAQYQAIDSSNHSLTIIDA